MFDSLAIIVLGLLALCLILYLIVLLPQVLTILFAILILILLAIGTTCRYTRNGICILYRKIKNKLTKKD